MQTAASLLAELASGDVPDTGGQEALRWTGRLLAQIDWDSEVPVEGQAGAGFAVQATTTRPAFYASLIKVAPRLREAGIKSEPEVAKFLGRLYSLLESGGADAAVFPPGHLRVGAMFLRELSSGIIVELSDNGLPSGSTWLTTGGVFA